MKQFDLYSATLDGTKLIEASAGTGKTFTLSGLYIRYIVEQNLLPEKILVLTFTKAATLELKTRLREQLIQCKNHINETECVSRENTKLFNLYEKYKQNDKAQEHIDLALACFDQAAIFTINGFCQKIIDDYNSECGSPVFNQLIDKKEYIKQFVYDFWRFQQNSTMTNFLSLIPNINDIVSKFYHLLSKSHYRQILPKFDWQQRHQLELQHQKLQQDWQEDRQYVLDYLFSGCFGRKYSIKSRDKFQQAMDAYMQSFTIPDTNFVERFTYDFLENERKSPSPTKIPNFLIIFSEFYNNIKELPMSFLYQCWQYVQNQLSLLLTEKGMYSYDDQIKVVHKAVINNTNLCRRIASQWQCIMVDEFQDTDALQLDIFQKCFFSDSHQIIFVGDPKQAIYDFRGADVFVYQQAKQQIQQQYNLVTNWRSSEVMLQASNALFDFPNSFKMHNLDFIASTSKPDQSEQLQDIYSPLTIINTPKTTRDQALANEIRRFIKQARIVAKNHSKPIANKEIAILVKSNKQAISLYEYLLSENINVSLWSESGVFDTQSAKQLYFLIRAISYPSSKNIRTSYHGFFFNKSLNELQQLDMQQHSSIFVDLRIRSHKQGLVATLNEMFHQQKVYQRLLQRIDGERLYTDLIQLIELLQVQQDLGQNEKQLLEWLGAQTKQAQMLENDEERKRRLESDGQKISIMTLHKSKGLEFSCVFIPYIDSIKDGFPLANENKNLKACIATHDENQQGIMYWQHSDKAKQFYLQEKAAENIRNLYVAVTRAKYRVYLGMDLKDKKFNDYPIAKLFNNYINNNDLPHEIDAEYILKDTVVDENIVKLQFNEFHRKLLKPQAIYSFSALTRKQTIDFERLDENTQVDYGNYFHFPKGSTSGSMQHEILEHINFNSSIEDITQEVNKQLLRYDFDINWSTCLSLQMHKILNTQLWKNGPRLSQLENSIDEMEFMLPVSSISNNKVSLWLSEHRNSKTEFIQDKLAGYLTGFIDLVFEFNGRYYVVDYKSNYLGGAFADYSADKLKNAIQHHFYDLQYLLYSVALVKYLQITLDKFDYAEHFGGISYIFTRGVNGTTQQGIYNAKPDSQLIENMLGDFDVK